MTKVEREYLDVYGDIPESQEDRIKLLEQTLNIDWDRVSQLSKNIDDIQWTTECFTLYLVPKPTPRARYSSVNSRWYVFAAAATKALLQKRFKELDIDLICTRIDYSLDVFLPTPKAMSPEEKYLAELKKIYPLQVPDWDNLGKTYTDAFQESMFVNDYQINPGRVTRYWSIKPRVEVTIKYADRFDCPYTEKKIILSKGYKKLTGGE